MPAHRRRERAGDRHLGHAERGEHGAGPEAERRRRGDERLDRVGVDGLGAVERDAQRRQVEAAQPLAAHAWRAPTRSSARRWRCRRRSRSTPSSCPDGRGSPAAPPSTSSTPVVIGMVRQPDEAHVVVQRQPRHQHVVVGVERRRRRSIASRFAPRTRCGSITPFGSVVEPLVYCRMTSRSGSCAGQLERSRARAARGRAADRAAAPIGGSPGAARRTARRSSISSELGVARGGCGRGSDRRTPRASPAASAAAAPSRRAPASQHAWMAVTSGRLVGPRIATWSPGPMPAGLQAGARRRGRRRGAAPRHEDASSRRRCTDVAAVSPVGRRRSIRCDQDDAAATDMTTCGREDRLRIVRAERQRAGSGRVTSAFMSDRPETMPCRTATRPRSREEIETRWQDQWDAEGTFEAPNPRARSPTGRGDGRAAEALRPRHVPVPVAAPACTSATRWASSAPTSTRRYKRMTGHNVLHTMGFDAFGLPAEQYAVQTGQHPAITTEANVANYRRQLRRLGLGHDPRRSDRHHRRRVLPLDAVDLPADLQLLVRPRARIRRRPIGELIAELRVGSARRSRRPRLGRARSDRATRGRRRATAWPTSPRRR